jgi:hypothetical protein
MLTIRSRFLCLGLTAASFLAVSSYAYDAHAGLAACGDIHVEASARCEVLVEGGCVAHCEPVSFEAACAAELHANCDGECNASASVDCRTSCEADCSGRCEVDPGSFDCRAECNADCQGSCSASCSSNDSECRAACEATCSASCDGRCEATPPSAECNAKCEASCEGSCEAEANVDCQVECQADGFAMCEADLQGGCEAQCQKPEGALFCDDQYIDHGGNLEECINSLQAELNIEVEGYAEAECANGTCEAEAGGAISCSVVPGGGDDRPVWPVLAVVMVLGGVAARRFV